MSDRAGRKGAMIWGVLLYSVATFMNGLAWDFWSLFAFRLLVGIGMAGEYSAGTTLLLESWPRHLRNKASGFIVSGWAMGGMMGSSAYALIVPTWGWRALFFIGIAPAILTLFIRFFLPESHEWAAAKAESKKEGKPAGISFFELFSKRWLPVTATLLIVQFSGFGMTWPITSLMPTYLRSIHYAPVGIGQMMFIANLGALFGYWFGGFLADRIGTARAIIGTILTSTIFLFAAFMVNSFLALATIMFLLQFTRQGVAGLYPKYTIDFFAVDVRASGLGITYNLGSIAGGLSPVWGGALTKVIGLGPAILSCSLFWSIVILAMLIFNVPKRVADRTTAAMTPVAAHA
jgi:SHS family sialic acid transporter-like MFS transporter